jgi:outer membrane protein assembly factor BamB
VSSSVPETPLSCPSGELPAAGALDLDDGEVRWMACSPDQVFRSVLGATDDVVVMTESAGEPVLQTVGLSAVDGVERWRHPAMRVMGDMPRGPVAGSGIVVRPTETGTGLVGYDAVTGEEVWRVDGSSQVVGQSESVVVIASSGLRGLDRVTGSEVWSSDVSFEDPSGVMVARGAAAVSDDTIVVPTGPSLTALDMATGATLWTAEQAEHPEAADGSVVGAVVNNGRPVAIRAFDLETGELRWEAPGRSSYGDLLAVGDGIVAVLATETSEVIAYELATGEERWRVDAMGLGEPQMIVGKTLILLWEANLSAVSTVDGSTEWTTDQPLGSPLMNDVATDGASVYVAVNSRAWGD